MADIAAIFHWPPSAFDNWSVDELMSWRELAIERHNIINGSGDNGKGKGR